MMKPANIDIKNNKIINFFDIDETIFFTTTKARIVNSQTKELIREIDSSQFLGTSLNENEEYDFSNFRKADIFIKDSTPNSVIIDKMISLFNSGQEVHIITARSSLDSKKKVIDYMKGFGIPVGHKDNGLIHIFRVGDYQGKTEDKKKRLIRKLIKNKKYKSVNFYDDSDKNLETFKELSNEFSCSLNAFKVEKENYYLY